MFSNLFDYNKNVTQFNTKYWTSTFKRIAAFLQNIKDPLLHEWAADLNRLWLQLGRKMKPDVKANQDLYSIIYVDNPVIVPGEFMCLVW